MAVWLEAENLVSLIRFGLEKEGLRVVVNSSAEAVGYESEAEMQGDPVCPDAVGDYLQGGPFSSQEFTSTLDHINTRIN